MFCDGCTATFRTTAGPSSCMTAAINTVLYPLKLKSWRSMQRMQKVAPEIRSIQDRYKKYGDARPAQSGNEQGSDGGLRARRASIRWEAVCRCWCSFPSGLDSYRMLTATLELRHAPWFGWITDLSARDPYYVLPVLMAVLMYVRQKMTPMTATDPSQQRMMALMPLMMGGMFIFFPFSSGLILYILTSSFIGVAQRWHLNRTSPVKAPARRAATQREA